MAIPETKESLEAAGYLFSNEAFCRGCGDPIEWWITPNGKKMPMEVKEVRANDSLMKPIEKVIRIPHWSNCVSVGDFRRK